MVNSIGLYRLCMVVSHKTEERKKEKGENNRVEWEEIKRMNERKKE